MRFITFCFCFVCTILLVQNVTDVYYKNKNFILNCSIYYSLKVHNDVATNYATKLNQYLEQLSSFIEKNLTLFTEKNLTSFTVQIFHFKSSL